MMMPETAVNEDARAIAAQHEIGMPRQPRTVEPVAESTAEEVAAHQHLRFGVLRLHRRHITMTLLWS